MNEELFNEATKSNVLSKKLIDQLQESMSYSSISFINRTGRGGIRCLRHFICIFSIRSCATH